MKLKEYSDVVMYARRKRILLKQLGIRLTSEQYQHMKELSSEIAIDNFAHSLIVNA
nr:hypothetical protein DGKKSRWO_DGKKSRWO_CDS_0025 [uncultured phage]CAI9752147.1 hypothetical protein CVNMHQAP_CVNMHQAP_CDS_0025 [uncultured phage]